MLWDLAVSEELCGGCCGSKMSGGTIVEGWFPAGMVDSDRPYAPSISSSPRNDCVKRVDLQEK